MSRGANMYSNTESVSLIRRMRNNVSLPAPIHPGQVDRRHRHAGAESAGYPSGVREHLLGAPQPGHLHHGAGISGGSAPRIPGQPRLPDQGAEGLDAADAGHLGHRSAFDRHRLPGTIAGTGLHARPSAPRRPDFPVSAGSGFFNTGGLHPPRRGPSATPAATPFRARTSSASTRICRACSSSRNARTWKFKSTRPIF